MKKHKDTERLDFLDRKRDQCRGPYYSRNTAPPEWRIRVYPITYWATTLRDCIDAAMKAERRTKAKGGPLK